MAWIVWKQGLSYRFEVANYRSTENQEKYTKRDCTFHFEMYWRIHKAVLFVFESHRLFNRRGEESLTISQTVTGHQQGQLVSKTPSSAQLWKRRHPNSTTLAVTNRVQVNPPCRLVFAPCYPSNTCVTHNGEIWPIGFKSIALLVVMPCGQNNIRKSMPC